MNRGREPESRGAAWRVIIEGEGDGPWNMAVDEAILEAYERADPKPTPTLRLYGWQPATLSLGRSQRVEGSYDASVVSRDVSAPSVDAIARRVSSSTYTDE